MNKDQILNAVVDIISNEIGEEPDFIRDNLDAPMTNAFELDSLDMLEMIMKAETEFSISIPDNITEEIKTVNGFVDEIEKLVNKTA